jgi:hypothetical protein
MFLASYNLQFKLLKVYNVLEHISSVGKILRTKFVNFDKINFASSANPLLEKYWTKLPPIPSLIIFVEEYPR